MPQQNPDNPRPTLSARGEKARANLMQAALTVMERVGYHQMRITDVTSEAGVATGLFYHYFPDLKTLTVEVLEDYVARSLNVEVIERDVPKGDWFERILAHNRLVVGSYTKRPGIMRCLLQLADEDADFSRYLRSNWIEQLNWLVKLMPRLFPEASFNEHQALMVIYTLATTGEGLLRDYYINRESTLTCQEVSPDEMAELLSVMFYRGLFLENPPEDKLRYTSNLHNMVRNTRN